MAETALTSSDRKELARLEQTIERNLLSFYEVGLALLRIRAERLYRETHKTFETYCKDRWDLSRPYAYQLMAGAEARRDLSAIADILPTTETQARPLTRIEEPERRAEAWREAIELAHEEGLDAPLARHVAFVVEHGDYLPKPETPPMPKGEYRVLYADPPWQFANSGLEQSAAQHYPTMATADICNLHPPKTPVLFLWATAAMLPDALEVVRAWGYEYKTHMVWVKPKGSGIGWYLDTRHELLLICVRGSQHPEVKPSSVIEAATSTHSKKPESVYGTIESMYKGPYLEMFARNRHEGWDAWGNETPAA